MQEHRNIVVSRSGSDVDPVHVTARAHDGRSRHRRKRIAGVLRQVVLRAPPQRCAVTPVIACAASPERAMWFVSRISGNVGVVELASVAIRDAGPARVTETVTNQAAGTVRPVFDDGHVVASSTLLGPFCVRGHCWGEWQAK